MHVSRSILCHLAVAGVVTGLAFSHGASAQDPTRTASLINPLSPRATSQRAAEARRPQLVAATDDAIQTLKRDIFGTSITADVTVRQLLYRTGGTNELLERIEHA